MASSSARVAGSGVLLLIILACQLMIVLDVTVRYTALPHIQKALDLSLPDLTWVQNAYTLAFGGMMLLGARAGDLLGRRRVFLVAVTVFTLASLLGGLAQSAHELLIARGVQGIAAAFLAPSTLALMLTHVPPGPQRLRAISFYTAVSGGGGALGLVLGGVLTDLLSWRWVMFINLPVGIALLALAWRYLQETERHTGHFDLAGALTVTFGMSALVYCFVRAGAQGWDDALTLVALACALVLLSLFVWIERRAEQPIMPLHLFASAERSGAYVSRMLLVGGMVGTYFFLIQYVQEVLGYTALKAGEAFLALTLTQFAMSVYGVKWLARHMSPAVMLFCGLATALVGMALLTGLGSDVAYFPHLMLPLIILGIGCGAAFVPLTSAGIAGVEPQNAGAASGLVNVAHQVGGSLGTAVIVAIVGMAARLSPAPAGLDADAQARFALSHALSVGATSSAVFFGLALVVVFFTTRHARRRERLQAADAAS
ncbi:MFS transporter [Pseudomonas gingeri]|uniref:MFS transporter n=1 Tax=Pseudomonas gingeri TaxID=117681 RepID=A0A7Y7XD01_9PSED|nr:MFS transporter [Pseudomonas gingeri]NWB97613.1 MFS transporter [Pseudomonas gingeri]